MSGLPLAGLRIVDLTHLWAGPLCTRVLTELGADVVKIEGPERPDPLRLLSRPPYGQPSHAALNAGKRHARVDLGDAAGRSRFLELLETADGVVDNFSPRALRNWGLEPSALAAEHDLLWVSMPSFPASGPLAQLGARGPGIEGASGLAALSATDGRPRLLGVPLTDALGGLRAALAFLARIGDGRGTHVEVSQHAAARDVVALALLDRPQTLPHVPAIVPVGGGAP